MESSYMKLYKDLALKKNKFKINKSRQNSTQQLKKNKSLTYYHFDGQINYINKFLKNELKNHNKEISNKNNNNKNNININNFNNNQTFGFLSNHEFKDNLLFNAYKRSVLELFKALKLYMNNELYKYNKIKREFINNIQKFYNEEKKKEQNTKKNITPNYFNIKSYSKKKIKEKVLKNKLKNNEDISISELYKNNSAYRTSANKISNNNNKVNTYDKIVNSYKYSNSRKGNIAKENSFKIKKNFLYNNKSLNKTNISGISFMQNTHKINFNSFNNRKSLYTLLKRNKKMLVNSPIKNLCNQRNDNIMKKFIKFSKDISQNKNLINKTCNQSTLSSNKLLLNEEKQNINENLNIPEKLKNNELISKIKDSLDDNLKHIFNFSYENFLNKESERDCN